MKFHITYGNSLIPQTSHHINIEAYALDDIRALHDKTYPISVLLVALIARFHPVGLTQTPAIFEQHDKLRQVQRINSK